MRDDCRSTYFRWSWSAFVVLLMLSTWRLWTSQHGFPQVPLLQFGHWWPRQLDAVVSVLALFFCLAATSIGRPSRLRCAIYLGFSVAMGMLFASDQHRLQPWAFQFTVIAIIFACCERRDTMKLCRWLVIGIYIYSAVSKLDAAFFASVGRELANTMVGIVGVELSRFPPAVQNAVIGSFPLIELLLGLALLFKVAPRGTVVVAMLMHFGLLLVLSPLGLDHKMGVLLWNVCFLVQIPILFWPFVDDANSAEETPSVGQSVRGNRSVGAWLAHAVVAIVLVVPAFEPWGFCDHWIAWGLYAPRSSRAELHLHSNQLPKIPDTIPHKASTKWQGWHRIDLSSWSLNELSVPIYPQSRFQLGVVESLIEECELDESGIHLTIMNASDRFTGARKTTDISRTYQRKNAVAQFWFGSTPRE
ncbi:MAG: hypothetical protein ACI9HK_004832 [Pirellulaceae bacterium]|jgi:hypothetical protein